MATDTPARTETRHWPTLVFRDEHGDLVKCDCGWQEYDFAQGREAFARHMSEAAAGPRDEELREALEEAYCAGFRQAASFSNDLSSTEMMARGRAYARAALAKADE